MYVCPWKIMWDISLHLLLVVVHNGSTAVGWSRRAQNTCQRHSRSGPRPRPGGMPHVSRADITRVFAPPALLRLLVRSPFPLGCNVHLDARLWGGGCAAHGLLPTTQLRIGTARPSKGPRICRASHGPATPDSLFDASCAFRFGGRRLNGRRRCDCAATTPLRLNPPWETGWRCDVIWSAMLRKASPWRLAYYMGCERLAKSFEIDTHMQDYQRRHTNSSEIVHRPRDDTTCFI